ncbi:MAG: acyloxyacyl hydrolase [Candidatus Omnitrophica bacterium]|nr:acyloxyacyl hydrolase [Candidatus Omnitrophota bacterium]
MKYLPVVLISTAAIFGAVTLNSARAQEQPSLPGSEKEHALEAVEFLSGFGFGELRDKDDARIYPLILDLDFDLTKPAQRIGLYPPGLLQFVLEPYFFTYEQPDTNIETGLAFLIKIGFLPKSSRLQPYFKAGAGLSYMTLQTHEQGDQFNFIEYGSLGAHYFIDENWAFTAEYRFRHLSNADLATPNKGINTKFIVTGLTYRF